MSRLRLIALHWGLLIGLGAIALWILPGSAPGPAAGDDAFEMDPMTSLGVYGLAAALPASRATARDEDAAGSGAPFVGESSEEEVARERLPEQTNIPFEVEKLIWSLASVILAAILGALIAYHPSNRSEVGAPVEEDVETPQIRIVVSVAAAIIIMAVLNVGVAVAFAIFGLSGFIRVFRVRLKSANDVSMILLCTCVGMISGFQQFALAIAVTAFVWILIWLLQAQGGGRAEARGGRRLQTQDGGRAEVQDGGRAEVQDGGRAEAQGGGRAEAQGGGRMEAQGGAGVGRVCVTLRTITEGAETRYRAEVDGFVGEGSTRKRALGNLWDRHPAAFPAIEVQETDAGFTARFKDDPGIALSASEAKRTRKRAVGALLLEFGSEMGIEIEDEK